MMKLLMATALASALATLPLAALASAPAPAPGYRLLRSFGLKKAPARPYSPVIAGPDGTLYGTTSEGGQYERGTVYAINPADGSAKVLDAFGASGTRDGRSVHWALVRDSAGNLYGVAWSGGTHDLGTVFKIDAKTHAETLLHAFAGGADDGAHPSGPLLLDPQGNLFGTTLNGGPNDTGVVFEISPGGTEKVVYAFGPNSGSGPREPNGYLALDSAGHLYGTTIRGGAQNRGAVYKLTLGTGSTAATLTLLHSFAGNDDGHIPSGVVLDAARKVLYGTTDFGGAMNDGTVFACAIDGSAERVVYMFQGPDRGDGRMPDGGLTLDSTGKLYGTTQIGGGGDARGILFMIDPATGHETVLRRFGTTAGDGKDPMPAPIIDAAGELVGVTSGGGSNDTGTVYIMPR